MHFALRRVLGFAPLHTRRTNDPRKTMSVSRRDTQKRIHNINFEVSPAMKTLAAKSPVLGSLPDQLLSLISQWLSLVPQTTLLRKLAVSGQIPRPLLVEMARATCGDGRRLAWNGKRHAANGKGCHRHHCRWRRRGMDCVTKYDYVNSKFLKRFFGMYKEPRGCWDVSFGAGPLVLTIFDRMTSKQRA